MCETGQCTPTRLDSGIDEEAAAGQKQCLSIAEQLDLSAAGTCTHQQLLGSIM